MLIEDYGMNPDSAKKLSAEQAEIRIKALDKNLDRETKKEWYRNVSNDRDLDRQLKEQELDFKKSLSSTEKNEFDRLPGDKQQDIKDLSKSSTNKKIISNQIESVLNVSKDLNDEGKLQQYRQLIKTLNSTEGRDAVAVEEAKRLASKLEFAMGNFTNNNPIQFGRDLEGFELDAANTVKALRDAAKSNESIKDSIYGRQPSSQDKKEERSVYPKDLKKDGKIATVKSAEEEAEARDDGWQ